jgi:hypothetical protein
MAPAPTDPVPNSRVPTLPPLRQFKEPKVAKRELYTKSNRKSIDPEKVIGKYFGTTVDRQIYYRVIATPSRLQADTDVFKQFIEIQQEGCDTIRCMTEDEFFTFIDGKKELVVEK